MTTPLDPSTRAVRAGLETDPVTGAVVPPIHLSSTFAFRGFGDKRAYDYSRSGNPTRDLLADAINDLEGGAGAVITGSGMGAITLVGHLLPVGARIVAPHDCYGGSFRLFTAWKKRGELAVDFIDFGAPGAIEAALATPAQLVWIETPSNPLLRITDVRRVAAEAHAQGALVVVDNTFLSPALQQPLALGADVVVHSTTKYLNGHSDVVGGAVVAKEAALAADLAWWANATGVTGAPFDAWLTLRGLRTLPVRWRAHERNARALAELLAAHPAVARVHFPGLASHEGHALARAQQTSFGAMLSCELAGGLAAVEQLVARLRCFTLAESLGGVESLVAHPATMTHASMDAEARARAGIGDGLVRLSVGIEDTGDLCADVTEALAGLGAAPRRREAVHAAP